MSNGSRGPRAEETTKQPKQEPVEKPEENGDLTPKQDFADERLVRERPPIGDPRQPNFIPKRKGWIRNNIGDVKGWVQAKVWDGWTFVTWEQLEREFGSKFPVIGEEDPRDAPYVNGAIRRRGGQAGGQMQHWVYLMEIPQGRYDEIQAEREDERLGPIRELYRNVDREKSNPNTYGQGLKGGVPAGMMDKILNPRKE